jgi:N-methylhydantoinase A
LNRLQRLASRGWAPEAMASAPMSRTGKAEIRSTVSGFAFPARLSDPYVRFPASSRVFVMQSSGGTTSAARAAREPVRTLLSGPAGGVVAAQWLAKRLGMTRAISFDMGGTSTDVSLLEGSPRITNEATLGGLPVAVPVIDIHSVGAGGGSLARLDPGGALRVGPESAGASPGPACYGRGGTRPTVTDANLLLGRLDADCFLGGTFGLDLRLTEEAFTSFLGQGLRGAKNILSFKTALDLARGILAVSNATMERALRVISVERGHDPRDFSLICFGGAGGLHAAGLAHALGLTCVVIPRDPGAFSALGILLSDIIKDVSHSVLLPVPDARKPATTASARRKSGSRSAPEFQSLLARLDCDFGEIEHAAHAELLKEHPRERARRLGSWLKSERRLDVRYRGQAYELALPFHANFPEQFELEHEKTYGYAHKGRPLEIVNLRVRLILRAPGSTVLRAVEGNRRVSNQPQTGRAARAHTASPMRAAILKSKPVWWRGRFQTTPFYERERLPAGVRIKGPAVVVEYSSTTAVPPGWDCQVNEYLDLMLSRESNPTAHASAQFRQFGYLPDRAQEVSAWHE